MSIEPDVFRTIPELLALYKFEPTVRDVYVEGTSDQRIVSYYLSQHSLSDVSVYEIGSVNIPSDLVKEDGFQDNNRGKVIFLARALERQSARDLFGNVVCIADADFDYLLRIERNERLLVLTDFTAMELYAFNDQTLRKFLSLVLRRSDLNTSDILEELSHPLSELFLIRAASQILDSNLTLLPIDKSCRVEGGRCVFEQADYVSRLLNKNSKKDLQDGFVNEIERLRTESSSDIRQAIHGHDFVDLLHWYLSRVLRPHRRFDEDFFEGALITSIETSSLDVTALFGQLRRRLTAA